MIRLATDSDRSAIYSICLRTGNDGSDATDLFDDPELPGDVWAGAYLAFEPSLAFVLEGELGGVSGYVLGARDTEHYEQRCVAEWWPPLRDRYPLPGHGRAAFETGWVHSPPSTPASITDRYPSHLHIDVLPAAQGTGQAVQLLTTLLDELRRQNSPGVHLGVSAGNPRAIAFYRKHGFNELPESTDQTLMMGQLL